MDWIERVLSPCRPSIGRIFRAIDDERRARGISSRVPRRGDDIARRIGIIRKMRTRDGASGLAGILG